MGLAATFGVAFLATTIFAVSLACAVIFYDGPNLRFGVGGLRLFALASPGDVTMSAFSVPQRTIGALLVLFLCAPPLFILHQARGVALVFAEGRILSSVCAQRLQRMAGGFVAYAFVPPLAHMIAVATGVDGDPIWLRFETFGALLLAGFLVLIARATVRAEAIQRDRDGFV